VSTRNPFQAVIEAASEGRGVHLSKGEARLFADLSTVQELATEPPMPDFSETPSELPTSVKGAPWRPTRSGQLGYFPEADFVRAQDMGESYIFLFQDLASPKPHWQFWTQGRPGQHQVPILELGSALEAVNYPHPTEDWLTGKDFDPNPEDGHGPGQGEEE